MSEFLKPSFIIALVMLLGATGLVAFARIGEASYLTITLAVGAGFGLSTETVREAIKSMARGVR